MKLKCSHCGNEELFYIIQTYSGMSCFEVNNAGECDETCNNSDILDGAIYHLKSVYYYCKKCNNKVEKIPLEKRF